jgi:hypothetical protein
MLIVDGISFLQGAAMTKKSADEALSDALKKYRALDPDAKKALMDKAIRDWAEAEAKYGKDDPAEGKIVIRKRNKPKTPKK